MIAQDAAKVILGAWLRGEHLEDVKEIPIARFGDFAPLAECIRRGETDVFKVSRATGMNIGLLAEMKDAKYEVIYQNAMQNIIRENLREWMDEHRGDDPEEIVKHIQESQRNWMVEVPEPPSLEDIVDEYMFEVLAARKNETTMMTGIPELDALTNGIHKGDLTALGARPSTGKSAFALEVATNVANNGGKVIFFALEMTNDQNMDRLFMRYLNGVPQNDLRSGDLTNEQLNEIDRVGENIKEMLKNNLTFLQERNLTAIEQIVEKNKPDLIIIDQLTQLTDTGTFNDVRSRFTHMTRGLKEIAMKHNIAVWMCCQLNRQVNGSTKPSFDYLKESGSIEEDSDYVILLSRDEDEEQARAMSGNRVINVNVAKQRMGPPGEFQVKFVVQRYLFRPLEEIPPTGFYETEEEEEF